jgi:tetratricopeptide (TPR) repeat protein
LALDPDNQDLKQAIKNIRLQNDLKDQATELFKANKIKEAIEKFQQCLTIDELNINYNATINFNLGMAYSKLSKNDEALAALNKAI